MNNNGSDKQTDAAQYILRNSRDYLSASPRLTGQVNIGIKLSPEITPEEFRHAYNMGELDFVVNYLEPDGEGMILRQGKVIAIFGINEMDCDLGPWPGETGVFES